MPRPRVIFSQTNWRGMYWATDVGDVPPGYAWFAENMLPKAGVYWRRPSFTNKSLITSSNTGNGQGLFSFQATAPGNGEVIFAVINGEIYGTSPGGTSFSKLVSTANLTTASITLSSTAQVFGCQFGGVFVLNDGINQPFTWDGTSGASGLTKLTNAPSRCYGKPVIYYGKLFFIKDVASGGADRSTLVWSEENAANTGYEATISGTTYNNAWTLTQMGQGDIHALLALNDGLYYFRKNSIGVIRGAVTPDFQAAGVRDDISLDVGCVAPNAVIYHNGWIWFLDIEGRPFRIAVGGYQLDPLWMRMQAAFRYEGEQGTSVTEATTRRCAVLPIPIIGGVLFMAVKGALTTTPLLNHGTPNDAMWLFDAASGDCLSNWVLAYSQAGFTAISGTGVVSGCVVSGSGSQSQRGIGVMVGTDDTSRTGWSLLLFPAVQSSAYGVSWPDSKISCVLTTVPIGGANQETRFAFSEVRVNFVIAGVPSGTKSQPMTLFLNGSAYISNPASFGDSPSSQTLSNAQTGQQMEHARLSWGLKRELPFLVVGVYNTASPTDLGWGVTDLDVVAFQLPQSPAWRTR